MLHGYLELTAWLLVIAVLGMVGAAAWERRHGHPKWAALLLVGALATAGTVGLYGWNLNKQAGQHPRVPTTASSRRAPARRRRRPRPSTSC